MKKPTIKEVLEQGHQSMLLVAELCRKLNISMQQLDAVLQFYKIRKSQEWKNSFQSINHMKLFNTAAFDYAFRGKDLNDEADIGPDGEWLS